MKLSLKSLLLSAQRPFRFHPKSMTPVSTGGFFQCVLCIGQPMTTTTLPTKPAAIGSSLDGPAIYIACLASYNAGTLHGFWCDLTIATTAEEIQECIDYVFATSPATQRRRVCDPRSATAGWPADSALSGRISMTLSPTSMSTTIYPGSSRLPTASAATTAAPFSLKTTSTTCIAASSIVLRTTPMT